MSLWKGKSDPVEGGKAVVKSPRGSVQPVEPRERVRPRDARRQDEGGEMANIGKSITIKGDVTGDEDLVIEGRVEGRIELKNQHLTIGPNGNVKAEIDAKQVTIVGRVTGNVSATERVEIRDSGRLDGDLVSPGLVIHEGAEVNGSISMKGPVPSARPDTSPQAPKPGTPAPRVS